MNAIGISPCPPFNNFLFRPPTPDALFNIRTGITITDIIAGENISIGNFPMTFMPSTSGTDNAYFLFDMLAEAEPVNWTYVGLFKAHPFTTEERRGTIAFPFKRLLTCQFIFRTVPAAVVSAPLAAGIILPVINWDEWQLIGFARNNSDDTLKFIWNQIVKSAADNHVATATGNAISTSSNVEYEKWYCRGFFAFNKVLSDAEISDIRLNGIFPLGCDVVICPWLDSEDNIIITNGAISGFQNHWDGVKKYKGYATLTSQYEHGFYNQLNIRPPTDPYSVRDSLLAGTYLLYKGYTRQGINVIPYKTDGTKGSWTADTDDIDYPATSVIHNMADSLFNFSGIVDATIKAIFDKSNGTYWKVSIQSEQFYIDAGGGYYGLWSAEQLTREFILTHAQAGHENHIFTGLRKSGTTITGLTQMAVYKISL